MDDPSGYLQALADRSVESLKRCNVEKWIYGQSDDFGTVPNNRRVKSATEGQTSEEVAKASNAMIILLMMIMSPLRHWDLWSGAYFGAFRWLST